MLNVTNIPAPRVNIIDERTGLISREWYRFFLNLFTLVGSGNNQTTLDDLQIGPPSQPVDVSVSPASLADTAPPSVSYVIPNEWLIAPPQTPVDTSGFATLTGNNTFTGVNVFANPNNQFEGLTYATSNGTTSNAYFGENSAYATIGGVNGVVLAYGGTYPGTAAYTGDSNAFRPMASAVYDLGTAAQTWRTVYSYNLTLDGFVTAGTWHGSTIGTAYGGTGATSLTGAGIVTTTDTQTISGQKNFTSYTNTFRGTTYATSDGGSGSNAYFGESGAYATIGGVNGVVFALGSSFPGSGKVVVATNSLRPWTDNSISCGIGAQRWTEIYAVNGTINTSDATEKQQVRELSESEQRVAQRVKKLIRAFKWNDAVAAKGDGARTHFGVMAQDVQSAFAAEGLDASQYGLFCSDTWTTLDGTSQTRLGVRYDELLAFVIAAI